MKGEPRKVYWCFHPSRRIYRAQDGRTVCGACGSGDTGEVYILPLPSIETAVRLEVPEIPEDRQRVKAALVRDGMSEETAHAITRPKWHGYIRAIEVKRATDARYVSAVREDAELFGQ